MPSQKYESGQLNSVLNSLFKKNASGILSLKTQVSSWTNQRTCILMLRHGALVYGELNASKIPNNHEICKMLGDRLKPNIINAALSVATEKISNPSSVRELTELLVKMKVFTWQEVEAFVMNRVVLILEQFLAHPGKAQWQASNDFDLSYGQDQHGLNWSDIKQEILQRQQEWKQYAPTIPSMDAIPIVTREQLQQISDRNISRHLSESANGKNTLVDIAEKMDKDPLKIAKSYANWTNNGWVSFGNSDRNQTVNNAKAKIQLIQDAIKSKNISPSPSDDTVSQNTDKNLPIVLSVDDSPIVQISIKRALQEQYKVLLANNAADALKMLDRYSVQLMLLDLTMPDIDGLEFCKMVRQIDKFNDLPIIMVTARDGLVNKMKGHIAGTSKYLTKPFQPEQLREAVAKYIHT